MIENHHITGAMHSCLEGYLDETEDSVEFRRRLTKDEHQAIFVFVSDVTEKATDGTETGSQAANHLPGSYDKCRFLTP